MLKILPGRYRYPLFFTGILLMELSGLLYRFTDVGRMDIVGIVIAGFLVFAFSILST